MKSGTVVEHLGDLGAESRDDGRIEECIESCENDSADNHTDDDLDTGIDVAFACLGGKGGLGGSADGIDLVTDGVNEFFHVLCYLSFLDLIFGWITFSARVLPLTEWVQIPLRQIGAASGHCRILGRSVRQELPLSLR